jgi:ABC-type branched-subunit amino acid transport system substrate-binding protein
MALPSTVAAPRRHRLRIAAVALAAAGLVLAACGSDNSKSSSSATTVAAAATTATGGSATTASGGATTAAPSGGAATTTGAKPTGTPIKVMTVAPVNTNLPPYPNIPAAAKVYEQYINDRGGIAGHPLQVTTCDDKGDPNVGADCARQAVNDKDVAVVGSFVFDASRIIPVLEQANIPWFGECCPLVAQEFSSPMSFTLGSLLPGMGAGLGWKMAQDGCKHPAFVVLDIPAGDVAFPAVKNAYKVGGGDPNAFKEVKISAVPGDYSAQVAEATSGTDCIDGGISDSNWAAWLPAMAAAGAHQRLYGLQGNLDGKIAQQFPDLTEGAIVSNSYPNIAGSMWNDYNAALKQYNAPDLDWNSLAGLGTWTAYTAFKNVAETIPKGTDITNQSFLDAANKTTHLDTGGMIGVLDLTKPYTGFGGNFPRIFNRSVFFDKVHAGKLTALDNKSYDMTGPIDGNPMTS